MDPYYSRHPHQNFTHTTYTIHITLKQKAQIMMIIIKKTEKKSSEKSSYIFLKTFFLMFQEMNLSSPKREFSNIKKLKKLTLIFFYIIQEMESFSQKLKKLLYFL